MTHAGAGGLVRAYSTGASVAIRSAEILDMNDAYNVKLKIPYDLYDKVNYILPEFEIINIESIYESEVTLVLYVKTEIYDSLYEKVIDISNGRVIVVKGDKEFVNFA